jgi:hypothetical protein
MKEKPVPASLASARCAAPTLAKLSEILRAFALLTSLRMTKWVACFIKLFAGHDAGVVLWMNDRDGGDATLRRFTTGYT